MASSIDKNLDDYKKMIFSKNPTIKELPEEDSITEGSREGKRVSLKGDAVS
jgi:hypothetical protein